MAVPGTWTCVPASGASRSTSPLWQADRQCAYRDVQQQLRSESMTVPHSSALPGTSIRSLLTLCWAVPKSGQNGRLSHKQTKASA